MVYKKLIPLLLGVLVMFVFLLKIKIILGCNEGLTMLKIFIFKGFQCVMGLDSWKYLYF